MINLISLRWMLKVFHSEFNKLIRKSNFVKHFTEFGQGFCDTKVLCIRKPSPSTVANGSAWNIIWPGACRMFTGHSAHPALCCRR